MVNMKITFGYIKKYSQTSAILFLLMTVIIVGLSIHKFAFSAQEQNLETQDINTGYEDIDNSAKPVDKENLSIDVLVELMKSLKLREEKIKTREENLLVREERLNVIEDGLSEEMKKLAQLRTDVESLLKNLKEKEIAAQKNLVKLYSAMKPDNAANALKELWIKDRLLVVVILNMMRGREAGKVLDSIALADPVITAEITQEMKIWNKK
ncbi:MAG: hypothetical protein A2161_16185 [Candidatus Schekmanbacteria bacterium RBG_13_48_7]|uniref:Magnesium transporter MgtE intracellular domain-containing protein n=1 Tax=Candidatus Schekmanbacteria bacterium RBG_13_48_7 TaxID=1817878 RepID=A0A1F7RUH1_9BACT|nr:MAG: hypothetical protein A2161_16185 [Candidatus Schekmanbacteria bacterium RBG_13_48_7]